MLSKCANPACTRTFRYLHEGKLFWRETDPGSGIGTVAKGEWFWLCDNCFYLCDPTDLLRCAIEKGPAPRSGRSAG